MQFELKTKLYFGQGESLKLVEYLKEQNFKKYGIVVDKALLLSGTFEKLLKPISNDSKILEYDLKGEPTYEYLDSVKSFFRKDEIDSLMGIGGGSVMDTAKGLAVLVTNPVKKSSELKGFPQLKNIPLPVVTIPTISGTGSEVTYNAVFTDEAEKKKLGINTTYNFPVFSICDPVLTKNAPLRPSLSSAFDCLVHALESFMSKKATFVTKALSSESLGFVLSGIAGILKETNDINARESIMKASYMAGIALMNSSSGPSGAASYPIGVMYKIPHGLAGAFCMRYILEYNVSKGYKGLSYIKEKTGKDSEDIIALIDNAGIQNIVSEIAGKRDIPGFSKEIKYYLRKGFDFNPVDISDKELDGLSEKISYDLKGGRVARV